MPDGYKCVKDASTTTVTYKVEQIGNDELVVKADEGVSVGSSQPHFVGSIEPIIVGNVRANGLKYKMPTTQICSL